MTDPRERLVKVGNDLLDVIYQSADLAEFQKKMIAATRTSDGEERSEAVAALVRGEESIELLVRSLELGAKRESLTREYVTIRQTLEAILGDATVTP